MCTDHKQRGISLIELIMFIVIVSVALAGIMLAMNQATGHSADALVRKQAQAVAASLLEEIEAQAVSGVNNTYTCPVQTGTVRANFNNVCDYNGYTSNGVLDRAGSAVPGLSNYNVAPPITVIYTAWGNIPQGSAVAITVHVTDPVGKIYDATGYRAAY